jgi:drug/metabolite transporter (DMT)-like permease
MNDHPPPAAFNVAAQYAMLLAVPVLIALGQVLFKLASATLAAGQPLRALATNPYLFAALVLYALGTLIWLVVLSRVDLVRAYPFAALSFVLVPLLGQWWLGEHLGPAYIAGVVLIAAGVVLCQW